MRLTLNSEHVLTVILQLKENNALSHWRQFCASLYVSLYYFVCKANYVKTELRAELSWNKIQYTLP